MVIPEIVPCGDFYTGRIASKSYCRLLKASPGILSENVPMVPLDVFQEFQQKIVREYFFLQFLQEITTEILLRIAPGILTGISKEFSVIFFFQANIQKYLQGLLKTILQEILTKFLKYVSGISPQVSPGILPYIFLKIFFRAFLKVFKKLSLDRFPNSIRFSPGIHSPISHSISPHF